MYCSIYIFYYKIIVSHFLCLQPKICLFRDVTSAVLSVIATVAVQLILPVRIVSVLADCQIPEMMHHLTLPPEICLGHFHISIPERNTEEQL